jgi:hypothetical protein
MDLIDNVALIIPIHPKHYHFIYNLLNKINNIDIILIFSNEHDYNCFNYKDKIIPILLPINTQSNSIVSYKKFYALDKLKYNKKYDYFIVLDAEIDIVIENFNKKNVINKIEKIFNNKLFYGGNSNDHGLINITKTSANIICNNNSEVIKLANITNNYTLYYWWSDLPVYKREHLCDFFSKFSYNNMNWLHFDHIIYLNYLILHHDFKCINLSQLQLCNWSLESFDTDNINKILLLKKNNLGFSWIIPRFFHKNKDFFIKEGTFILYHLDR